MAHKTIVTNQFLPDQTTILFGELAELMATNQQMLGKLYQWWGRDEKPCPNARQHYLRDLLLQLEEEHPNDLHQVMCYGGVRSGKTVGVIAVVMEKLLKYPGARALGVRRTYTELMDSLFPSIKEFLDEHKIPYTKRNEPPGFYFSNGSCWLLRSTEKSDKMKEGKADTLGGQQYAYAVMEEANEIKESFLTTLVGRMSQTVVPMRAIFVVQNPPGEDHWTYQKFLTNRGKDRANYHAIHFPIEDNESNLPPGYIKSLEEEFAESPTLLRKFRFGEFGPSAQGKPIFGKIFSRQLHVPDTPLKYDPTLPLIRIWDFGWRRPAVVVCQDDPETMQIKWLYCRLGQNTLLKPFAEKEIHRLKQMFPGRAGNTMKWRDICDVAGKKRTGESPKSSVEILEGLGLRVESRYSLIEYGLNILVDQLAKILPGGEPAMVFDKTRCGILIDAFEFGYCQDENVKEDELKPVKDGYYDHLMDCARYAVVMIRELTARGMPRKHEKKMWRKFTPGAEYRDATETLSKGSQKSYARYSFGRKQR